LDDHQVDELIPAAEFAGFAASAVGLVKAGESMSRNNLEHLMKDRVAMSHGLICPFRSVGYEQHHYTEKSNKSGLFLYP